jgi:hypothetical protein
LFYRTEVQNKLDLVKFKVLLAVRMMTILAVTPCRLARDANVLEKRTVTIFRAEVAMLRFIWGQWKGRLSTFQHCYFSPEDGYSMFLQKFTSS